MSVLKKEIQEAINKNLSTQIGHALKERLLQADEDASALKVLTKNHEKLKIETDIIKEANKKFIAREVKSEELTKREYEVSVKEQIFEIKEKCAASRISDMKEIVGQVFANNKFKYTSDQTGCDCNGNPMNKTTYIEQEG